MHEEALLALAGIAPLTTACGGAAAHPAKQTRQPPDAYLTAHGMRAKMAGGSYCWTVMHGVAAYRLRGHGGVVAVPGHFPQIRANRGDKRDDELRVLATRAVEVDFGHHSTFVPATRRPTLTVPGPGILQVVGHGSQGDASYAIRIIPRSG